MWGCSSVICSRRQDKPLKSASEHKVFSSFVIQSFLFHLASVTCLRAFNHEAEGGMGMEGLVSISKPL